MTSTYGNTYHQGDNVVEGHFAFEAAEAGDYMTCFFAADHKPPVTLSLDFDWRTGVAAKDWTSVAKKGSVEVSPLLSSIYLLMYLYLTYTCVRYAFAWMI